MRQQVGPAAITATRAMGNLALLDTSYYQAFNTLMGTEDKQEYKLPPLETFLIKVIWDSF